MDNAQEQKFQRMTQTPVKKLVCQLAVPTIISMLVTSFYNMADTFFVGMLQNASATAGVGIVYPLMAIIQAVGFFVVGGYFRWGFFCLSLVLPNTSPRRGAPTTTRTPRRWRRRASSRR